MRGSREIPGATEALVPGDGSKVWTLGGRAPRGGRRLLCVCSFSVRYIVSVLHADAAVIFLKYPPDFHAPALNPSWVLNFQARKSKTLFGDPQLGIVGLF